VKETTTEEPIPSEENGKNANANVIPPYGLVACGLVHTVAYLNIAYLFIYSARENMCII
jgi:predicted class III extradiol MEMO1 family dioxygenase